LYVGRAPDLKRTRERIEDAKKRDARMEIFRQQTECHNGFPGDRHVQQSQLRRTKLIWSRPAFTSCIAGSNTRATAVTGLPYEVLQREREMLAKSTVYAVEARCLGVVEKVLRHEMLEMTIERARLGSLLELEDSWNLEGELHAIEGLALMIADWALIYTDLEDESMWQYFKLQQMYKAHFRGGYTRTCLSLGPRTIAPAQEAVLELSEEGRGDVGNVALADAGGDWRLAPRYVHACIRAKIQHVHTCPFLHVLALICTFLSTRACHLPMTHLIDFHKLHPATVTPQLVKGPQVTPLILPPPHCCAV
jgi:hypothetical protein